MLPNAESRRPFVARGKRGKRRKSRGNCRNAFLALNRIDEIREQFIHLEGEDSTASDSWGCKQCLELISFGIHLAGCNKYFQCIVHTRQYVCKAKTRYLHGSHPNWNEMCPLPPSPCITKKNNKVAPVASLMALLNSDLRRDLRLSVSRSRSH